MDNYYIFLLSKTSLSLVILIASIFKIFAEKRSGAYDRKLLNIIDNTTQHPAFITVEVILGLIVLFVSDIYLLISIALLICCLNFAGITLSLVYKDFTCNCFGGIPKKQKYFQFASSFIVFFSLVTFLNHSPVGSRSIVAESTLWFVSLLAVFLFFVRQLKNKKDKVLGKNSVDFKPRPISDRDIGSIDSSIVRLSDYAKAGKPIFLTGVNSNCNECSSLLPDVEGFAKGFGEDITLVLITDSLSYVESVRHQNLNVVLDEKHNFIDSFKGAAMPYGLIVFGETLEQKAPVSYGANSIRYLFTSLLNARH